MLSARAWCIILAVAASVSPTASQVITGPSNFAQNVTGDGTSYGPGNGGGHCSFQISGVATQPWITGINYYVAAGHDQYADSRTCGLCLRFRGTRPGGTIPLATQFALVADECPECTATSLDFQNNFGGRDPVNWVAVQCDVGSTPFVYSFQGSNSFFIKLQVANTRVPALSAQLLVNGAFRDMTKVSDNYFQLPSGGPFAFPTDIRVTSILGDTVRDTIRTSNPASTALITGTAQFPLRPDFDIVGRAAGSTTPTPSAAPTTPSAAPTTPSAAPTRPSAAPTTPSGAPTRPSAASTTPSAAPTKPSAAPTTPSAAPTTPSAAPTKPSAAPTKPSAAPTAPSAAPTRPSAAPSAAPTACALPLAPYSQCGGRSSLCTAARPCQDAAYPSSCCSPGTNPSQPFACSRQSEWYYQCIPAAQAALTAVPSSAPTRPSVAPSAAPSSAPSAAPTRPSADPAAAPTRPSAASSAAPTAPSSAPTSGTCSRHIAPYSQCGGSANACGTSCRDAQFPGSCCDPSGGTAFGCARNNQYNWQCVPAPQARAAAQQQTLLARQLALPAPYRPPKCLSLVGPYGQCGGRGGSCSGALCQDKRFANSCCAPVNGEPAVCRREHQWYWQCVPEADGTV